jgi:hypothetical protein
MPEFEKKLKKEEKKKKEIPESVGSSGPRRARAGSEERLLRQYLYVCTSKASKLAARSVFCVSICTFVLVKQVN